MSADLVVLGWQSKAAIGIVDIAVKGGSVREMADDHDVSDTESGQYKHTKGGMTVLQVQLDCELAFDVFPSSTAYGIIATNHFLLTIWPYGKSHDPIVIIDFVVLEHTPWDTRVGDTVKFSFSGKSNGAYLFPVM